MKDRIIAFIEAEGISAAEFADKIGVQRSSVSHVLNGRNNPGFAFIQKILEAFPSIDSRWLLTGEGSMYGSIKKVENKPVSAPSNLFSTTEDKVSRESVQPNHKQPEIVDNSNLNATNEIKEPSQPPQTKTKKVVKVLIFYDDHTFEDFRPAE